MRYPLPYAFARTARLLLEDDGAQRMSASISVTTSSSASGSAWA